MKYRDPINNAILVLSSVLLAYAAMETMFRFYIYRSTRAHISDTLYAMAQKAHSLVEFDVHTGFRYRPNKNFGNLRSNEYGMVANDRDTLRYPVEKPASEFRIAVLGDSFTAGVHAKTRWPDFIQDALNESPEWRAFVGGRFTRVLNFGLDGTGIVQAAAIYAFRARQFSPDLVIVNIYVEDILRRFTYRNHTSFDSKSALRAFIDANVTSAMAQMPWFNVYPELLAQTVGRYFGLKPRLAASRTIGVGMMDREEGIRSSIAALEEIRRISDRLLIVHLPVGSELSVRKSNEEPWQDEPLLLGLLSEFRRIAASARMEIVEIVPTNAPEIMDERDIQALFLPDGHYSDHGNDIYASWLSKYIITHRGNSKVVTGEIANR
jgi:hypothetical protein